MARTQRSTGEVVGDATTHLSDLMRAHVDLAKAEVQESIQATVRKVVIPFVLAAFLAAIGLAFLISAAARGIAVGLPEWASWLITGGALVLLAGIFALLGSRGSKSAGVSTETTKQQIQETATWAKQQTPR